MPDAEKMSITLTPELAALVHDAGATGNYASTSEVIREALRDWRMQQLQDVEGLIQEAEKLREGN